MRVPRLVSCLPGMLVLAVCATAAEKPGTWIEVRSPHFTVVTNAGEKQGRHVAAQFEQIRSVFSTVYPKARMDDGKPFAIFGAKDEKSFRTLLPEYWEKKGHFHPAGVFYSTMDKHYVVLRLDEQGSDAYSTVYHEYFHMVESLNFQSLPLWLNEGMADFFANTQFEGKQVNVGKPSGSYLQMFQQRKLLPLAELLAIDESSPYYNEENKVSIFYAESWALVHYLMVGDRGAHRQPLADFLQFVSEGMPTQQAAERAFGDLNKLGKALYSYIGLQAFYSMAVKAPSAIDDKEFAARALSPAEAVARQGDFLAHSNRPSEARAALEEALKLDPQLALAQEGMGLLAYKQGDREGAEKWYGEAAQQNSQNFMAQFFDGMLKLQHSREPEVLAQAAASLQRSIALNPNFASAYDTLASLYLISGENLDRALEVARKAVELEPAVQSHRLNYGHVLMRLGKVEDAVALGERLLASAQSPQDKSAASSFLEYARQYQQFAAAHPEVSAASESGQPASGENPQDNDRPELKDRNGPPSGPVVSALGTVVDESCSGTELSLLLKVGDNSLPLHAADLRKIAYSLSGWAPAGGFNPCKDLVNLQAKIGFRTVEDESYAGEITYIELRK